MGSTWRLRIKNAHFEKHKQLTSQSVQISPGPRLPTFRLIELGHQLLPLAHTGGAVQAQGPPAALAAQCSKEIEGLRGSKAGSA